uniref:Uncharacterized protein n=1 Tax=Setaria viridis TaxID=4556 RepID=A0A4U6SX60_SETVI|nr:hypothetical protein SEVIR_9G174300v2 [Setaria viridis]
MSFGSCESKGTSMDPKLAPPHRQPLVFTATPVAAYPLVRRSSSRSLPTAGSAAARPSLHFVTLEAGCGSLGVDSPSCFGSGAFLLGKVDSWEEELDFPFLHAPTRAGAARSSTKRVIHGAKSVGSGSIVKQELEWWGAGLERCQTHHT